MFSKIFSYAMIVIATVQTTSAESLRRSSSSGSSDEGTRQLERHHHDKHAFSVYAVNNNCGTGYAKFDLYTNRPHHHSKQHKQVHVDVQDNQCVYVGAIDQDTVHYKLGVTDITANCATIKGLNP